MKYLAIDTETTGLYRQHGCRAFMVTCCNQDRQDWCFEGEVDPFTRKVTWEDEEASKLAMLVGSYNHFIFLNAGFDLGMLHDMELDLHHTPNIYDHIMRNRIDDVGVMAHVVDNETSGRLKDLALEYLRMDNEDEKLLHKLIISARRAGKKLDWDLARKNHPMLPLQTKEYPKCDFWMPNLIAKIHPELVRVGDDPKDWLNSCETYGRLDAVRTAGLFHNLHLGLQKEGLWDVYDKGPHRQCIKTIHRMTSRGLPVAKFSLPRELNKYDKEVSKWAKKAAKLAGGINLNSPDQVSVYLFEEQGCPVTAKTDTGKPSTSYDTLQMLCNPQSSKIGDVVSKDARKFLEAYLNMKKNETAVRYLRSYYRGQSNRRLYPSIRQCGTGTTRVSSANPNGQNIGKGDEDDFYEGEEGDTKFNLRCVFGPQRSYLWFPIDYNQFQLRIFATLAEETKLIKAFEDGWDAHTFVACSLFDTSEPTKLQRRVAKAINFGLIFGAGRRTIDKTAGMDGAYSMFKDQFPAIDPYMESTLAEVRKDKYVTTAGGYRLWVPYRTPYAAVCYKVQGTEGEIVKEAMNDCEEYLMNLNNKIQEGGNSYGQMIMQVHDELIFEIPTSLPENTRRDVVGNLAVLMEKAAMKYGIYAPAEADKVTKVWSEAKPYLSSSTFQEKGTVLI